MATKIKMKTHKGASKRFKVLKSGKVKFTQANRRHHLIRHSTKYKRGLRKSAYVSSANAAAVKKMLPYS